MPVPAPIRPRRGAHLRGAAASLLLLGSFPSTALPEICPLGAAAPHSGSSRLAGERAADLERLDEPGRGRAAAILAAAPCLCGCRHTLASCRLQELDCDRSRALVGEVARRIGEGRTDDEVRAFLRAQPILPRPATPRATAAPVPGPGSGAPPAPAALGDRRYEIPLAGAPVRGSESAPVTIVEFADFRCPFCTRSQPLLQQVLHLYEGRVRLLFKHFPLSSHAPMAEDAALAALAAQKQDAFWGMHDRLFGERAALDPPSLVEAARQLGLDVERFRRDLEDPGLKARLEADIADGRAADLTGTPTFYVNGRKLQRVSLSGFRQAIEQALADSSSGAGKR